jgi:hypothetical protein
MTLGFEVGYTPYDAVSDIIFWQIPAAFIFALAGMCYVTVIAPPPVPHIVVWNVDRVCFLMGFVTTCWMSSMAAVLCLDMIFLPPAFAFYRLWYL